MKHHSSALITCLAVAATLVSGPVLSQVLDEIIVTARKREESLQQVSLAISAFSQDYLDQIGATDLERLDALTPGLSWGQHGLAVKISIRGMHISSSEANADSPVGFFVDGVYLGRGQQYWNPMVDVERVEVLRGPQGTLFGRNTSGGSINIITRKPSQEFEAKFELTAGDYNHIGTSGHINFPMSDNWAGRLTFFTEEHDGYLENTYDGSGAQAPSPDPLFQNVPGDDQMDEELWYVRGALRYDNGPLVVDFAVDAWDQGGNGNAFSGAKFFSQTDATINGWAAENCFHPTHGLWPTALCIPDPGEPPFPVSTAGDWQIEGNRSFRDVEAASGTLTISYDFANVTLKSITAYNSYDGIGGGETDFTTVGIFDCRLRTDTTAFSQELQLSSNNAEKLEWTVGLYYLDEENVELFAIKAPSLEDFLIGFFGVPDFLFTNGDFLRRDGTATAESTAIYGQGTYSFNEHFRLTLGARFTSDDKTYTNVDSLSPRGISPAETFEETTWIVGLDYLIDDSRMVYGHISTGYKAGGFNRYSPPPPPLPQYPATFQPETVINYAIGFKGDLADNTLRLNVEAFYNEIDDFQAYAFDNTIPTSVTENAAESSTKGVELEMTWLPSEPAQITFVAAYLDAVFDSYTNFTDGRFVIDASGNQREQSPKWKTTLAASYDFNLGSMGTLTPYLQFTYKDDYFITPANNLDGLDKQDSYTQTDIRLIWNSPERHWRGELFVENIEDNFVKVGGFLATGGYWITYGPEPTLFGAKLAYTF
ncbi:MAG: TonB-dependent receptor [Gammaproteobacteria bacterium]|nr:MAG: TonB-dependent receptor [Gammaproteobacteria bacterium]